MTRPLVKPIRSEFSSGPCAKRPGWSLDVLQQSSLGRSHRHKDCKNKLKEYKKACIDLKKSIKLGKEIFENEYSKVCFKKF